MKFGEKLRKLRQERGYTVAYMAGWLKIGERTYRGYESGGRYPRDRSIYGKLAVLLGCDVNYLLTEEDDLEAVREACFGSESKGMAKDSIRW